MQKSNLIHTILYNSLTFHYVIILTKSVFNKDKNNYYSNISSNKFLYKI